ncbi:MAG: hypothetical protein H6555_12720 [Lewinellaceae bacterium]|nr:hypothetical protein [Lewinellaceae bacterium]
MSSLRMIGWLLSFSLLLSSCQPNNKQANSAPKVNAFFDLATYIDEEAARLDKTQPRMLKILAFDEKNDSLYPENVDFVKELKPFRDADINKLSWIDKYRTDSLFSGSDLQRLTYTALDSSLSTRRLQVDFAEIPGQVAEITIQRRSKSVIAVTDRKLSYQPQKGYSLESWQGMRLVADHHLTVDVAFIQ